jgi:hypothetical protein
MDRRSLHSGAQGIDCSRVHMQAKRVVQMDARCPIESADRRILRGASLASALEDMASPPGPIVAHIFFTNTSALPTTTISLHSLQGFFIPALY